MDEDLSKGGAARDAAELAVDQDALNDIEGDDAAVDAATEALITRPKFEVGNTRAQQFTGEINLPWLKVAHGVGKLSKVGFSPGDLVLNDEVLLYSPPRMAAKDAQAYPPLRMVIVNYTQYFKEYQAKDARVPGVFPKVFATAQEAHAAGFTTEWDSRTQRPPTAPKAMTWLLLIEEPKGQQSSELFCMKDPVDGIRYAPARMVVDKGAYLSVKDKFGMVVNFTCRERGYDSVVWDMTSRIRHSKSTGNDVWVPWVDVAEHMKDDKLARVRALVAA